jgi:hypothetical protein
MTGAVTQRSSTKAFIVCVGCAGGGGVVFRG